MAARAMAFEIIKSGEELPTPVTGEVFIFRCMDGWYEKNSQGKVRRLPWFDGLTTEDVDQLAEVAVEVVP